VVFAAVICLSVKVVMCVMLDAFVCWSRPRMAGMQRSHHAPAPSVFGVASWMTSRQRAPSGAISPVLLDSSFWVAGGGVCAQTGRASDEGKLQLHCVTAQPKLTASIETHSCLAPPTYLPNPRDYTPIYHSSPPVHCSQVARLPSPSFSANCTCKAHCCSFLRHAFPPCVC
jgi:hypothetical protein